MAVLTVVLLALRELRLDDELESVLALERMLAASAITAHGVGGELAARFKSSHRAAAVFLQLRPDGDSPDIRPSGVDQSGGSSGVDL